MIKPFVFCSKNFLRHLKHTNSITEKSKPKEIKEVSNSEIKPEDVIVLIDGSRSRRLIPKAIIDDYDKSGNKLDFKSTYSIKGIIVEAYDVNDAIEQYKEIKSNLLED